MQQKELYNVCTYIMTCQEQLERSPIEHGEPEGTLHMHINRRSSIIVSRSVPIFWFPFEIFSIKPISRALFGHVGSTVCTIPSHGAVARSVAARAHTAFPACNLRLTFNLPSFINSTVNLSRRSEVNNQTPLLLFFNIHHQLLRWLST